MFQIRRYLVRILCASALLGSLAAVSYAALPEASPKSDEAAAGLLPDDREAAFMQSPSPAIAGGVALPDSGKVGTKKDEPSSLAPLSLTPKAPSIEVPSLTKEVVPSLTKEGEPAAPGKPIELAQPVTEEPLRDIDPESVGLLAPTQGGLGAALWQGTPRVVVEKLLPEMGLPTSSPTMNGLARRLLLSTAEVPQGAATPGVNLTALRLEKLVALGQTSEAWKLAKRATLGRFDEATIRLVIEGAITGPEGKDVCEQVPNLIAAHKAEDKAAIEGQKALIVCQFLAKDLPAAQTGLDVMREQKVRDDLFLSIANRNIVAASKQLPHQLTPLKPLTLALLRLSDLPLPSDLFARPETSLIPDLLLSKAASDEARLALAERAASKGIISAAQLSAVYKSVTFTSQDLAAPQSTSVGGATARALFYQAAQQEGAQKRGELVEKMAQSVDMSALEGSLGQLLAEIVAGLSPSTEQAAFTPTAARIMTLAGKPEQALVWLKAARAAGAQKPEIANALQLDWPLFVLSGLVPDSDYSAGLKIWLDGVLKESDRETPRALRQKAGNVLLMLSAAGYAIPEDAALRVVDVPAETHKTATFSPLLFERLRVAGTTNRRGEAVLLSLLLAGGGVSENSLSAIAEAVRALRLTGLSGDAQALARETVVALSAS